MRHPPTLPAQPQGFPIIRAAEVTVIIGEHAAHPVQHGLAHRQAPEAPGLEPGVPSIPPLGPHDARGAVAGDDGDGVHAQPGALPGEQQAHVAARQRPRPARGNCVPVSVQAALESLCRKISPLASISSSANATITGFIRRTSCSRGREGQQHPNMGHKGQLTSHMGWAPRRRSKREDIGANWKRQAAGSSSGNTD